MKIDPLDININGWRILSDTGIKQALDWDLVKVTPSLDYIVDSTRIQPATIDLKIKKVVQTELLNNNIVFNHNDLVLPAHSKNEILLTEKYEFAKGCVNPIRIIWPSIEARSSLRRPGCYVPNQGNFFFTNPDGSHIELNNYSCNDFLLGSEERVAQMFIGVDPFKNSWLWPEDDVIIEKVNNLDIGLILDDDSHIDYLLKKGYFDVGDNPKIYKSFVLVHASDKAYKFKKLDNCFDFSNRKKYDDNNLLEVIDISKGYDIYPGEHVIIETVEYFKLSSHIGIRFWDNHMNKMLNIMSSLGEHPNDEFILKEFETMIRDDRQINILTDGWIDPGYEGGFSRQPKWNNVRRIKKGDVIGMGQVFYFPNGVGNVYGSQKLGSQYQKKQKTTFSK